MCCILNSSLKVKFLKSLTDWGLLFSYYECYKRRNRIYVMLYNINIVCKIQLIFTNTK